MWRIFVSLYLLIAFTLAGFVFGLPMLVEGFVQKKLYEHAHGIAALPQYILEQELKELPSSQWRAVLEARSAQFGYPLQIHVQEDFIDDERISARLAQNLVAVGEDEREGVDYMLLPFAPSNLVVRMDIEQSNTEHAERTILGFITTIEQQLAGNPPNTWPHFIEQYAAHANFPVLITSLQEAAVEQGDLEKLQRGDLVWYDIEGDTERYFRKLANSDLAVQIGPITEGISSTIITSLALLLLASLFAIVLFFWIKPLWQDLLALRTAAAALGSGELNQRVEVSKRSRVAGLAETFNSMADRIGQLLSSHKELTDAVSHELRTPISRMQFALDMLEDADSEKDQKRYTTGMQADIKELEDMVNELLTYSRMDRPAPELYKTRIDINSWFTEIIEQEMSDFSDLDYEIVKHKQLDEDLLQAFVEPRLLQRAVRNLLRNAARHTQSKIVCTLHTDANNFTLSVADDGPGIPIELRERLFEPFVRTDNSRHRDEGGYGLGLAIVKRICEWLDGSVSIQTSPLGGAEFLLCMPRDL
ncbi:MAG: ATP-binding protein [Pseudomonadales bacterium]